MSRNDFKFYAFVICFNCFVHCLSSSLLGSYYKYQSMKPYNFNNKFLEPLLSKIIAEGKAAFFAGDFNLMKHKQSKGFSEFLEYLFSNNFVPKSLSQRDHRHHYIH